MESVAPNRTLYVRNLPEKLSKPRLRRLLHAAFSAHGRVVWIVAEKTVKLRGQAFITFEKQAGATVALRAMQGSDILGHNITVAYARQLTDRAHGKSLGGDGTLSRNERAESRKMAKLSGEAQAAVGMMPIATADGLAVPEGIMPATGTGVPPGTQLSHHESVMAGESVGQWPAVITPNHILFVQGLPTNISKDGQPGVVADILKELFAHFAGFVEVRSVPGKNDIAFVEFLNENDAAVALSGLNGHMLGSPPRPLLVSFAKK